MILQQKAKERRTLELWSVRIIQRVFRGHRYDTSIFQICLSTQRTI